uniref:NECAP PHear domain-containing protein n=1 Tax=Peronospora matthiolae TaxID=2874970 RepID=A0AAV1SY35_9STRA
MKTSSSVSDPFVLERCLFSENNVWFYRVPAGHVTSLAPRADAWDPEYPLLTGSLRIVQKGDACSVQLFESLVASTSATRSDPTPPLFAQCPLQITRDLPLDVYVHDCVDSSRYFMVRVTDDESGRRAFVGIGFPERATAFNFKATLQDYAKYALRQVEMEEREEAAAGSGDDVSLEKSSKLSLPEGAMIRIKLKTSHGSNERDNAVQRRPSSGRTSNCSGQSQGASRSHGVPLIPPPPSESSMAVSVVAPPRAGALSKRDDDDEEDWGDFTAA